MNPDSEQSRRSDARGAGGEDDRANYRKDGIRAQPSGKDANSHGAYEVASELGSSSDDEARQLQELSRYEEKVARLEGEDLRRNRAAFRLRLDDHWRKGSRIKCPVCSKWRTRCGRGGQVMGHEAALCVIVESDLEFDDGWLHPVERWCARNWGVRAWHYHLDASGADSLGWLLHAANMEDIDVDMLRSLGIGRRGWQTVYPLSDEDGIVVGVADVDLNPVPGSGAGIIKATDELRADGPLVAADTLHHAVAAHEAGYASICVPPNPGSMEVAAAYATGREVVILYFDAVGRNGWVRDMRKMMTAVVSGVRVLGLRRFHKSPSELRALISAAPRTVGRGPKPLRRLSIDSLIKQAPRRWLLKGCIAKGELGTCFGPWSVFKTTTVLSLAVAVADGGEFLGRRLEQGIAVHLFGEGGEGMANRLRAAVGVERMHDPGDPIHERLVMVPGMPAITNRAGFDQLASLLSSLPSLPALVIFDTYHLLLGACGLDENSSSDVGKLLDALNRLRDMFPDVVLLLVHHSGVSGGDRERGSTALPAAADFRMQMQRNGKPDGLRSRLSFTKAKDAKLPVPVTLTFEEVEVGVDGDGEKVTSLRLGTWQGGGGSGGGADGDAGRPSPDAGLDQILELLADGRPRQGKELIGLIPVSSSAAYNWLKRWVKAGKVKKDGTLYCAPSNRGAPRDAG